jgi:hypothetical protein
MEVYRRYIDSGSKRASSPFEGDSGAGSTISDLSSALDKRS